MTDEAYDVDLKLWVVMNRAVQSVEQHLRRQVERHGLSFTEFAVLEVLLHKGTLPIGEIGDRVLRSSGSMTYVVDKLEKRGLIERLACPDDRRIVHAALTDQGEALVSTVFTEHKELLRNVLGGLSLSEKAETTERMKRLGLYAAEFSSEPTTVD